MYQPLLVGKQDYLVLLGKLDPFASHWHSEIEIFYCLSGYIDINLDGICERVQKGSALLVESCVSHEILSCSEDGNFLVIEMGTSFLGINYTEFTGLRFPSRIINLNEEAMCELKALFDRLAELQKSKPDGQNPWEEKGILFLIADAILKKIPSHRHISAQKKQKLKKISNIYPLIEYVRQNYMNNITIAQAADVVGYDRNYFCKCFKEATGTSFHDYLNRYRVTLAQNIIRSEDIPLGKVGEMVGIPEPKSFSRIFKAKTGILPNEYKKNIKI